MSMAATSFTAYRMVELITACAHAKSGMNRGRSWATSPPDSLSNTSEQPVYSLLGRSLQTGSLQPSTQGGLAAANIFDTGFVIRLTHREQFLSPLGPFSDLSLTRKQPACVSGLSCQSDPCFMMHRARQILSSRLPSTSLLLSSGAGRWHLSCCPGKKRVCHVPAVRTNHPPAASRVRGSNYTTAHPWQHLIDFLGQAHA